MNRETNKTNNKRGFNLVYTKSMLLGLLATALAVKLYVKMCD